MKISVVSPFYNEEAILSGSVNHMLSNLEDLEDDWELIIVNDGSTDTSLEIARELVKQHPEHLKIVSYPDNRGRGYALRAGFEKVSGDIIVSTEIDSSWGDDIVRRIVEQFKLHRDADMVIASPHMSGGGYRNVPQYRVFLSSFGNKIIQAGLTHRITMFTGMTRGYKKEKLFRLPLDEDGKEIHLEIVNKACAFGYHIYEIPAVLEWQQHKFTAKKDGKQKRKSSSKIFKIIGTHTLFSVIVAPFRYIYPVSSVLLLTSLGFIGLSLYRHLHQQPEVYALLIALFLLLFAVLFFSVAVLAQQGRNILMEMWRFRGDLRVDALREISGDKLSSTSSEDEK